MKTTTFGKMATAYLCSAITLSLILMVSQHAIGKKPDNKGFPSGCYPVGHTFIDGRLVLTPLKVEDYDQTVFFMHNVSNDNLKIKFHHTKGTELYPKWETKVSYNQWAAFATDKHGLQFSCSGENYSDYSDSVNCQTALKVCQYPRAKFAEHNNGNYWVTSNKAKYTARNDAIRKGILLRGWYPEKDKAEAKPDITTERTLES